MIINVTCSICESVDTYPTYSLTEKYPPLPEPTDSSSSDEKTEEEN